jgi:alpha-1,4-digalacturonate transport system substrate-binding protein
VKVQKGAAQCEVKSASANRRVGKTLEASWANLMTSRTMRQHSRCRNRLVAFSVICLVLCIAVLILELGCSASDSRSPQRQLKLVWFGSEEETNIIKQIIADFERENPHLSVEIRTIEWLRYDEKLMTMLIGGRTPDVARMSAQWCPRYATYNVFADIQAFIPKEELSDFMLSRLASCRSDGKLIGLPQTSISLMTFYNKDIAARAGIKVPQRPEEAWTWSEFEQAARAMMQRGGARFGWTTFKGWFPFLTFFYENGGRILSPDLKTPRFASPENVEALRWFVEQHRSGVAPQSAWLGGGAGEELYMRGICAMSITGSWRLVTFSKRITDFEWDVTFLPREKRLATNVGGENFVVFDTKRKADAARLALFLCSRESIARFCSETLFIPTRNSLLTPDFKYKMHQEKMYKFVLQSKYFEPEWALEQSTPQFAAVSLDLEKNVELAILGKKTPREALADLDEKYAHYED